MKLNDFLILLELIRCVKINYSSMERKKERKKEREVKERNLKKKEI